MGVIIKENKLVIITEPKTIYFDLPKRVGKNLSMKFILPQNALNF